MVHNPYRHPQATSGCHALFLRKGLMTARHLPRPFAFIVAALCERRNVCGGHRLPLQPRKKYVEMFSMLFAHRLR
jgi:hypothetical protein